MRWVGCRVGARILPVWARSPRRTVSRSTQVRRQEAGIRVLACVLCAGLLMYGCSDDEGTGLGRDAAASGNTGGSSMDAGGGMGGGGTGGAGGMDGGSAGVGANPGGGAAGTSGPHPCTDYPVDAGSDHCLACLLAECCNHRRATSRCLLWGGTLENGGLASVSSCYTEEFSIVRDCFEHEVATGNVDDSTSIALDCTDDIVWEHDGGDSSRLPISSEVRSLTECVVYTDVGDANYEATRCASECFPRWR